MNGDKLQLRLYLSPRFVSGDSLRKIQFFIHSRSTKSTTRGIIQIIACMKIHHGGHIVQLLDSIYIMSNHKSLLSGGAQQILFTLHC